MQWPWNISDEDFVQRIERFHSHRRRPMAAFQVALSVLAIGFAAYLFNHYDALSLPVDTTQPSFLLGVMCGYWIGKFVILGVFTFGSGLHCLFAYRKDQMLVSYHHRLLELGELDIGS